MALARTVALVLGAVYLLVGIVGFIPLFVAGDGSSSMPSMTGQLFGIFPINALHNIVHIITGAVLLYGATATSTAILVSRVIGAIYLILGVIGIPLPDGFGLVPLGGADILLHLATGVVLLAIGFMGQTRETAVPRRI